ncbi:alpha/beta hydrolase [Agriterribacter sp.]|uniref:alpha/beta hydrolase n=1 Tax=Agriterribacter sp. TaxID=2821509 RepID=UPI002B603EBC|nr:alpha/beta hydrolase [Agriterribacter sp.]HRO45411.1 alpha/beta hydrolase [Agriterribacter sp.]HRQ16898.1 alpha/beta hydrolase [Agriterribacter sp.]
MNRSLFLLWLTISVVLLSCKKEAPPPDLHTPAVNYTNMAYGNDARQVMDIFLPEGRTIQHTKTIFIIHGGGWTEGDKADMAEAVAYLKKELPLYAFVNVNYRLASNGSVNIFPAQEEDIKSAVGFYLNRSGEYLVSEDLVMGGASAGAHLAMLHSYKNDPGKHVKAVVDFFGPTDLVALWNEGVLQQWALLGAVGRLYTDNPDIYVNSSPLNFITNQSPPTIALQGGADFIVIPAQTTSLVNRLIEQGVKNQLVYYPLESHGWAGANLLDSYNKIIAFIKENVK